MFDKDINRSYLAVRWFVVQAPMTIRSQDLSFFYVTFEGKHPVEKKNNRKWKTTNEENKDNNGHKTRLARV